MTAVVGEDPTLALKCLDLCQALIGKGLPFSLSLASSPSSGLTFSLDTRKEESTSPRARKKLSPSTLRRNARRKKEFLKRKAEDLSNNSESAVKDPARVETLDSAVEDSWSSVVVNGDSKSIKVKLKKKPTTFIPQFDGEGEEVTKDAATETDTDKPETTNKAAKTINTKPVLELQKVQQTNIPAETKTYKTLWTQTIWTIPVNDLDTEYEDHTNHKPHKPYRPPHSRNKT